MKRTTTLLNQSSFFTNWARDEIWSIKWSSCHAVTLNLYALYFYGVRTSSKYFPDPKQNVKYLQPIVRHFFCKKSKEKNRSVSPESGMKIGRQELASEPKRRQEASLVATGRKGILFSFFPQKTPPGGVTPDGSQTDPVQKWMEVSGLPEAPAIKYQTTSRKASCLILPLFFSGDLSFESVFGSKSMTTTPSAEVYCLRFSGRRPFFPNPR